MVKHLLATEQEASESETDLIDDNWIFNFTLDKSNKGDIPYDARSNLRSSPCLNTGTVLRARHMNIAFISL